MAQWLHLKSYHMSLSKCNNQTEINVTCQLADGFDIARKNEGELMILVDQRTQTRFVSSKRTVVNAGLIVTISASHHSIIMN